MQLPPTPTPIADINNAEVIELAGHLESFSIWDMSSPAIAFWNSMGTVAIVFQVFVMITIVSAGVMRQVRQLSAPDETPPNAP